MDDLIRRDSVESWKPPDIEEFKNATFNFQLPSFATAPALDDCNDGEMEEIEDIEDVPPLNLPTHNFRLSGVMHDLPDLDDIPDISEPNLDFDYYNYELPDFTVPAAALREVDEEEEPKPRKEKKKKKNKKKSELEDDDDDDDIVAPLNLDDFNIEDVEDVPPFTLDDVPSWSLVGKATPKLSTEQNDDAGLTFDNQSPAANRTSLIQETSIFNTTTSSHDRASMIQSTHTLTTTTATSQPRPRLSSMAAPAATSRQRFLSTVSSRESFLSSTHQQQQQQFLPQEEPPQQHRPTQEPAAYADFLDSPRRTKPKLKVDEEQKQDKETELQQQQQQRQKKQVTVVETNPIATELQHDYNNDDDDDDKNNNIDLVSFPRKGKPPKKPKRDQTDIPKILTPVKRQSTTTLLGESNGAFSEGAMSPSEQPQQQPKLNTASQNDDNNAENDDIPTLFFEGIASLDVEECETAMETLTQLLLKSREKCIEAVDLGGHGVLVVTMKKWQYNKKIQKLCCESIHHIIYNYHGQDASTRRIDIMEALAVMGALECIIRAMDKFVESLSVQRFGLAAMGNLLYGKGKQFRARARKAVEELDVITTIVGAMRRFPKDPMVQGCGCIVLTGFYKLGDYKALMLKEGTLLDVANAVTNHPDNASIEKEASTFMKLVFGWNQT